MPSIRYDEKISIIGSQTVKHVCFISATAAPGRVDLKLVSIKENEMTIGWHVSDDGGCAVTSFLFYYVVYRSTANHNLPAPRNISATKVHA